MRRGRIVAPWVMCALMLPALQQVRVARAAGPDRAVGAGGGGDQVSTCVTLSQTERDRAVDIELASRCEAALSCRVRWSLVCDGDAKRRAHARTFALAPSRAHAVTASAAACGDGGWSVRDVRWSCHSVAGE